MNYMCIVCSVSMQLSADEESAAEKGDHSPITTSSGDDTTRKVIKNIYMHVYTCIYMYMYTCTSCTIYIIYMD